MSDSTAKMFWNLNQHLAIPKAKALIFDMKGKSYLALRSKCWATEKSQRPKEYT